MRRLARAGARLFSITQEPGDDPAQVMMHQFIALFDGYQFKENAKHVLRARKENAKQGFHNGALVPLGCTVVEVEKRGVRIKKRLAVGTVEAETVRSMFSLYRQGDGSSGPLEVEAITCHLNERSYRTRAGARFGVATIHGILTNRLYVGEWMFNRRCSRTLTEKPEAERIPIPLPAIIALSEFEAVQATTTCGGPTTLRTGTSKSGKIHRYYNCSTHRRQGKTGCTGRTIRMDTLDALVTDRLVAELLQPDRLRATLASLRSQRAEKTREVDGRVTALRRELEAAEDELKRLYRLVEDGLTDLHDILRERLADLKQERDRAEGALDRIYFAKRPPTEIASKD